MLQLNKCSLGGNWKNISLAVFIPYGSGELRYRMSNIALELLILTIFYSFLMIDKEPLFLPSCSSSVAASGNLTLAEFCRQVLLTGDEYVKISSSE